MSNDAIVLHDECDEVWIVKQIGGFMPSYKVTWLLDGEVKYKQVFKVALNGQQEIGTMFDALLRHVAKWEQCKVSPLISMNDAELARGWKQPFSLKRLPDEYLLGGQ